MSRHATVELPVVIVGGGPVGLSTALALSKFGIQSLLVERHPATSTHPKARGIDVRTMELIRQWRLEPTVRAAGLPPEHLHFFRGPSLTSQDFTRSRSSWTPEALQTVSPTSGLLCSQDILEPVLLRQVQSLGLTHVAFGTHVSGFEQNPSGVRVTLVDGTTGQQKIVQATYLVAADGAGSGIRDTLGIAMVGPALAYNVSILFRADLEAHVADRQSALYSIASRGSNGVFMAVNNQDRWVFATSYRPALGERPEDFSTPRCTELVRKAVGLPNLAIQIESVLPWTTAARLAEQFRIGHVFLAGDAVHQMTPMGAFGMNTGIQDAHNLAWKLAAVLGGWAGPGLLETYQSERRPIAEMNVEQSRKLWEAGGPDNVAGNLGLVLGQAYRSTAVVADGRATLNGIDAIRVAQPGARAPHVWLYRDGQPISTLDLFGAGFVLLTGSSSRAWGRAAEVVSHELHVPLDAFTVGVGGDLADPDGAWCASYGVSDAGAVLVRPDGHVAWIHPGRAAASKSELRRVLPLALGLTPSREAPGKQSHVSTHTI